MDRVQKRLEIVKKLLPKNIIKPVYLDVGIGDATITIGIAKYYNAKKVYGATNIVDFNISEVEIIDTSNYIIDLPENSIDLITAFMSLHHLEPKKGLPSILESMRKVAKPGAYFFIRDHDVGNNIRIRRQSSFKNKHQVINYLNEIHKQYGDDPKTITYWDKYDLRQLIESYGFKHIADFNAPIITSKKINNKQMIYHSLFKLNK